MLLQHSTSVKVLSRLGVNACKEFQRQSPVGVLARVRQGNKICSICKETFSSTQVLRTHFHGQHIEAPHLKCDKCDYYAGDAYALRIHKRRHDTTAPRFHCQNPGCCYIVGLGLNCKFIDLLFKRSVLIFIKISSFIVSLFQKLFTVRQTHSQKN